MSDNAFRFFLFGIAIDVTLNLLLIPRWQAFGLAVAAVATQVFISGAMVWLSVQEFEFRTSRRGMVQVIGFALFVGLLDYLIFEKTTLDWGLKFFLALAFGLIGLFAFQMIDLKKARQSMYV